MSTIIRNRIANLREKMSQSGIDAYLINGSDPHMSEYVPDRWKSRDFISGFTGSYGWLAITMDKAVLWTDSRYYLQAQEQLSDTGIDMFKAREADTQSIGQFIVQQLKNGNTVGFDGSCYSSAEVIKLEKEFKSAGISMIVDADLLSEILSERPSLPNEAAFLHPLEWAGASRSEKFNQIEIELNKCAADLLIISALDDLGWTFNLRGADVESNPVVLGYGIIGKNKAQLYIDINKLDAKSIAQLNDDGVELLEYNTFYSALEDIKNQSVFIDTNRTNYLIYQTLKTNNKIIEGLSFPALLKSVKNKSELSGMKKAHITDGLALLDFQLWIEHELQTSTITEFDVAEKLMEVRSLKFGYVGPSFFPIVGYQSHGAIVHFKVSNETANTLKPEGVLLIDSGGQYTYGTTDITRTIALGEVSEKMKKDFTLVLKGMINLTTIKFPKGTYGCHLDVLARSALWNNNLNYGHGTGHGVGAFMNVHEGPGSIRPDLNDQVIRAGNIFSNEPGLYRTGEYGIRIENLIYCVEDSSNEFGDFLKFETLTKYPIDTRLIDKSLLSSNEINWLNQYHQKVLSELSYYTNSEQFELLKRLTLPL